MKPIRIAALFLSLCIALPAVLTSCDNGGSADESKNNPDDTVIHNGKYVPNAPKNDFNAAAFRIAGMDPDMYNSVLIEFDFEEDQEDIVYEAIYRRNRAVEERYNLVFENDYIGTYNECRALFEKNVTGNDSYYSLYMMTQRDSLSKVLDGAVIPSDSIPYLDFSQPWYQDGMNSVFNIDGIQLLCYTDTCMCSYLSTVCLFFNQNIVRDRTDIDNPYDLVENGTWTLDNFFSLANTAKTDLNGDGFSVDDGDIFGIAGEHDGLYASMWIGSDVKAIDVDGDGELRFNAAKNEKFTGIVEKVANQVKIDGLFCNSYKYFSDISTNSDIQRRGGQQYFSDGKALFKIGGLGEIQTLRNMEADFGLVPLPKYDENQKEYRTRTADGWIYNVPSVSDIDLKMAGTVIDALGAEAANYVKPAFFEKALQYKYIRETDKEVTLKMLNLIFDSAIIDLSDTFLDCFAVPMWTVISEGNGNYQSSIDSLERRVKITLVENQKKVTELANSLK